MISFRKAAWLWLAPPDRRLRARLMMEVAYVADREAVAAERLARSIVGPIEESEAAERRLPDLRALADQAAQAALNTASGIYGLDDAHAPIVEDYYAEKNRLDLLTLLERRISDFIWGDDYASSRVLLGERFSVGPYVEPARGAQGKTFACLDWYGVPVAARGAPVAWTPREKDNEWTADRAAAIFVAMVGFEEALSALARALGKNADELLEETAW